jgi:acyl carrier protein
LTTGDPEPLLREYIVTQFGHRLPNGAPDPEMNLLGEGVIDSMGVMQIVSFIEETFSVAVEDDDISPANFRSLRTISELVQSKTGA